MPRPPCCRRVRTHAGAVVFRPMGVPTCNLTEVVMALDEFEALRLADWEELYQQEASERMGVSRATFGRIVATARHKVADALIHGRLLRIEGGPVVAKGAVGSPSCPANFTDGRRCPRLKKANVVS